MRHSSVALLQGQDVYEAYKTIAPNAHKVLNVQVTPEDRISADELDQKLMRILNREPLTITYAGRAIAMKGPFDWLKAVERIAQAGVKFNATWFGEGDLLEDLIAETEHLGLSDRVMFRGKTDRAVVMAQLRQSDIFMFCHKTAESPRCLVEALASSAPPVGYQSLYAADLVAQAGGAQFVALDDWSALADAVIALDRDRAQLTALVRESHATAQTFDRDAAMERRIALIRQYVTPPVRA